jgi:hypothetical protein
MSAGFCGGCGAALTDDVRFCTNCGRRLTGSAPRPAAPAGRYVPPSQLPPIAPRRSHKRTWIVVGAVVAVLVLVGVAGTVVQATAFSAKASVNAYFGSLASGDADGALTRLYDYSSPGGSDPGKRVGSTALLSGKVLRDRSYRAPTDPEIESARPADGSSAAQEVKVSYTVGGSRQHATLYVARSDKTTYGLFHRWLISGGTAALALAPGTPYLVDGVHVGTSAASAQTEGEGPVTDMYPVFPGTYRVGLADNPLLSADSVTVDVRALGGFVTPKLTATIKKTAAGEVRKQVDAYLDECAKQASLTPTNCPFSTYGTSDVRNISWTITRYPTIALLVTPETNAVRAYTGSEDGQGVATVTYEAKDFFGGKYTPQTSTASIDVGGPVVVTKGKLDWLSPADLARD